MASRRQYLTQADLEQFADITVTDATEADDQISQAEEMIDEYVGYQRKFLQYEITGMVASGGASTFTLQSDQQNNMQKNYLRFCWVEIIGGTGEGQQRKITGQTYEGVTTVESAFSPALDTTSYYRIWQLGKFPRQEDVKFDGSNQPNQYYKGIPEKIKRATAAQVEFIINMGPGFFASDKADMQAESIGDYSYQKGSQGSTTGAARLIAPKAKQLLRGIMNRTGIIL